MSQFALHVSGRHHKVWIDPLPAVLDITEVNERFPVLPGLGLLDLGAKQLNDHQLRCIY